MDVPVDHARQGEQPAAVDRPGARGVEVRADRFDGAAGHADVDVPAVGEAHVREKRGFGVHVCYLVIQVRIAARGASRSPDRAVPVRIAVPGARGPATGHVRRGVEVGVAARHGVRGGVPASRLEFRAAILY